MHGSTGGKTTAVSPSQPLADSPEARVSTAAAPGPSGHTTPNLTSAPWSDTSVQKQLTTAATTFLQFLSKDRHLPATTSLQKPTLPALSAGSATGTKGRSVLSGAQAGYQRVTPCMARVKIHNPPKDTAAHSTPPDPRDTGWFALQQEHNMNLQSSTSKITTSPQEPSLPVPVKCAPHF